MSCKLLLTGKTLTAYADIVPENKNAGIEARVL